MATRATSCGARTLLKPTYTGGAPASRNATRSAGSGRYRAGSRRRSARRRDPATRPRAEDRVHCQPRPAREDVVADVVHRRQSDRRAMGVERVTVERIDSLRVDVPQHPVVRLARRERSARPRQRRLVRRREAAGEEADAHVVDAQRLGNRSHACGHQTGRHHSVTALGRGGDRVELHGDEIGRRPRRIRRRQRLFTVQHLAQRLAHRDQLHVGPRCKLREVRWCAHPHLRAELPQPQRESHQRFDIPA